MKIKENAHCIDISDFRISLIEKKLLIREFYLIHKLFY